jgi:hypothetical protein
MPGGQAEPGWASRRCSPASSWRLSRRGASLRWPAVTASRGADGRVLVRGDEGELTRLADRAPGAVPDFAVLFEETGGDESGRKAAGRFPGFDAASEARHWDQVTADVVTARIGPPPALEFFTGPEAPCARALLNLLTGQDEQDGELAVPVYEMVDLRLEASETDGWRYAHMPEDGGKQALVRRPPRRRPRQPVHGYPLASRR